MSKRRRSKDTPPSIYKVEPQTDNQQIYYDLLENWKITHLAVSGPSGSGKSLLACQRAAKGLLSGEYDKIYLSRSITPIAGENLGHLPGSAREKMHDWLLPLTEHLVKFLPDVEMRIDYGQIEYLPLAQIRGRSLHKCFLLVTESQNLTLDLLEAIITRTDDRSKLVLDGDFRQNDRRTKFTDYERLCQKFQGRLSNFAWAQLGREDIMRSKHIQGMLDLIDEIRVEDEEERKSPVRYF